MTSDFSLSRQEEEMHRKVISNYEERQRASDDIRHISRRFHVVSNRN